MEIYFMQNVNGRVTVAGDELRDEYIAKGYAVEGKVDNDTFVSYSAFPRGKWWDIVSGTFVPKYTVGQLDEYKADMLKIDEYKKLLKGMDYKTNKYVEGLITDDEWAKIKAERNRLRVLITDIEARWGVDL